MSDPASPKPDLEAALALVMAEARRDARFAERVLAALKAAGAANAEADASAVPPAPVAVFDPFEPNIEVALMQKRDDAVRAHLASLSFAQLAKMVKAQRIPNVRPLFEGRGGEPASKDAIVSAMLASVQNRIKGRFSAAS
jgi:hypothetical protein